MVGWGGRGGEPASPEGEGGEVGRSSGGSPCSGRGREMAGEGAGAVGRAWGASPPAQ